MQTSGGATALMYACQQCRESEVLDILRKQPFSVKDRDRTLKTTLHYCAENPNTSCAEAILKVAPELVNAQDENGYCPLHLAVIAGNKPLIKLLIMKGADVNVLDNEGHSAVHWAIVSSEKEALEMIIRAGANPSTPDIHGGYPLHYAVQMCGSNCEYLRSFEDTVRVVESLLNVGVDVNVKDKDGRQPILWAASAGSADAVIHLVSSGACVEAADKDGLTALHCAASRGHTTTLETLITLCGANVDVIDGNGCSALFYSVTLGHADATELLLKLGAEPNRQDRKGRTPAHCGAAKGQLETLRILQKHGGNLWMRNVKGDIPLHDAVASGRKDLVIWLLSQNSEAVNLANNDGRCPLHIASMYNNTEMVKVLLDSKSLVNPVMRTSKGILMTPLNVALCKGHRSCGKYLQLHGGVPFSKVSRAEPTSVFAVRVLPSDDIMTVENGRENVASSQSKISKSRSSSDVQANQETLKTTETDKKKVYRRRKKKKNPSNLNTQDSDSGSDDSVHELKVKILDTRKSTQDEDEGNDEDEEKTVRKDKQIKKEKSLKNSTSSRKTRSTRSEEAVVVKKATKNEKSLQRNKSFNETKNVSDLSPEDFPPRMQIINQLDTVIMEPDADVVKSEIENIEARQQDTAAGEVTGDSVAAQIKTEEGVHVEMKTTSGLPVEEKNNQNDEGNKQDEEVTKAADVKEANEEESKKSSNDEGSTRKSVKSPKSSNDESSVKKDSKKGSGGSERRKKTRSPKTLEVPKEDLSGVTVGVQNSEPEPEVQPQQEVTEVQKPDGKEDTEEKNVDSLQVNETEVAENVIESAEKIEETKPSEIETKLPVAEVETKLPDAEVETKLPNAEVETKLPSAEVETKLSIAEAETQLPVAEVETKLPVSEEETKLPVAEVEMKEIKTVNQVETSANSTKNQESFSPEENIKAVEDITKPSEEPEVFLKETTFENTSEGNNPSEQPIPVEDPSHKSDKEESQVPDAELNPNEDAEGQSDIIGGAEEEQIHNTKAAGEDGDGDPPGKRSNGLEQKHYKTPRVSRLCRRHREFKEDMNQVSVTQLVQNTIRKYHMERGIFYQLLELKRYQIRSGKANEQVLVKRLADEYDRSRIFLGMKPFSGLYKFREFEKFLYDQLKALNARRGYLFPEVKSYDDIDALSGFLKKSRYKIISEIPQPEMVCTCITQRCHHSACAYTSVPCSAYITDLRRHRLHKPRRESFFPRIEQPPSLKESQKFKEQPATLELIQGSEKHVITLPQSSPDRGKRYYVTFTIKGVPGFKEDENSKDYFKHRHAKSV